MRRCEWSFRASRPQLHSRKRGVRLSITRVGLLQKGVSKVYGAEPGVSNACAAGTEVSKTWFISVVCSLPAVGVLDVTNGKGPILTSSSSSSESRRSCERF
jgi:hypothetical protein